MKNWLQSLRDRTLLRRTTAHAITIADRSKEVVWDRVQNAIYTMDVHEARGYVRARSAAVVRQQTALLLGKRHRFADRNVARMQQLATERVIQLILVGLLSSGKEGHRLAA